MVSTKEQERKALAQIRKIVDGLGENSYLGMAFEGCFEIAEENIENDFGCSLEKELQKAKEEAAYFKRAAEVFSEEKDKIEAERDRLKACVLPKHDLTVLANIISEERAKHADAMDDAAKRIVEHAEYPSRSEFAEAVADHKAAKARYDTSNAMLNRMLKAIEGYVKEEKNA